MDVDMIFKIAAIGIIVAILNQLLVRSGREEQALLTTIAGLVVALMMIISQISDLFSTVKSTFGLEHEYCCCLRGGSDDRGACCNSTHTESALRLAALISVRRGDHPQRIEEYA